MALFETPKPEVTFTPFATFTPSQIYAFFKEGFDCTQQFTKKNVPMQDSVAVLEEIKRIEAEVISKASGSFILTAETGHYDEETHEYVIDTPEVRYTPTTLQDLAMTINSPILDVDAVVADCIKYNPSFKEDRTFEEFKASFNVTL